MSNYAVIKGASYILAAAPDMVLHNGTTQTTEMVVNPESEYLKELPNHLRSFDDVLSYIDVYKRQGEILGLPRKTLVYRMEKLGIK